MYLAGKGATPQRVLWASTSTKNPAYPDTLYVDELIGPDTVNTMPEETILAFQDHGSPRPTLREGLPRRKPCSTSWPRPAFDYDELTETVEREGVEKFEASLHASCSTRCRRSWARSRLAGAKHRVTRRCANASPLHYLHS